MGSYRTWREALENCNVPDQWDLDVEAWPEWCWPHLTDAMVSAEAALPFKVVYAALLERSGLPMPTRAVLHYLARRCGGTKGKPRRCWPKLEIIADRVGASRRTVQRAIEDAEARGWVLVVRHTRAPSDYVLDIPDMPGCPCLDCVDPVAAEVRDEEHDQEREGVRESPQGVRATPLGRQSDTPRVSESHTHLVHALGSSLDSKQLRASPNGDGTVGATEEPSSDDDQEKRRDDYRTYGARYAERLSNKEMTQEDVRKLADTLQGDRRAWFIEGLGEALGVAS